MPVAVVDPVAATLIGGVTVACVLATFGFTVLNYLRSGMGSRVERLEREVAECQSERLHLEHERGDWQSERIGFIEEIARISVKGLAFVASTTDSPGGPAATSPAKGGGS